jgi:tetratricopeptide (TPR) repeat protein
MKDSMGMYKGRRLCVTIFLCTILVTTTLAWRIPTQPPSNQDQGLTVDQVFKKGLALQVEGDDDGAKIWYQLALKKDSTHWPSLDNLGLIYYRKWKFRDAENCWIRSRRSKSCNVVSTSNLAGLYTEVGLYSRAIPLWEELERIDPDAAKRHQTKTTIHECYQELKRGGPRIDGGWYELMHGKINVGKATHAQIRALMGVPDSESDKALHYEGRRFRKKNLYYRNVGFILDDRGVVKAIVLTPEGNISPKGIHYMLSDKTIVAEKPHDDDKFPFTEVWRVGDSIDLEVAYYSGRDGGLLVSGLTYMKTTLPRSMEGGQGR